MAEPRTGLSPGTLGATQLTGQLRACREGLGCGQQRPRAPTTLST